MSKYYVKLRDVAKISSGSTPSRALSDRYYSNEGTPWVKTGDLNNSHIISTSEQLTAHGVAEGRCKVYPSGTILVAMYGGFRQIGRTGLLDVPAAVNQAISAIVLDQRRADPEYVLQYLNGRISYWRRIAASSRKDPNITRTDVENFPIVLPEIEEQKRVAAILKTWDQAVDRLGALLNTKERFMSGVLATCVGDARAFNNSAGWSHTTVGEVTTIAQSRVSWEEDATYKLITVKRNSGGLVYRGDRRGHEILTKDMYTVRAGDFLISKRQVVHGAWAMITPQFDGGHVSKEYTCLRAQPGKLWMPYFDWLSRTDRMRHEAFICSYGVDIEKMVLNVEWLLKTPLILPNSLETQRNMAATLDLLQKEISIIKAQRDILSKQKQGLAAKLLGASPNPQNLDEDTDAMSADELADAEAVL